MTEEQSQQAKDKAIALQAGKNIYVGLGYRDIKEIFMDLFQMNFPKMQEEAKKIAESRVQLLLEEFRDTFERNKQSIDPSKFSDPLIQYQMQEIAIEVAKRGEKSNMKMLCELLCVLASKETPELSELIAVEACKLTSKISQKHIDYLSFLVLNQEAINPFENVHDLDQHVGKTLKHISKANDVKYSDLNYLSGIGLLSGISGGNMVFSEVMADYIPSLFRNVDLFSNKKILQAKEVCEKQNLPNIEKFYSCLQECCMGLYDLTAAGKLIGWINLQEFSQIDTTQLFRY